MQYTETKTMTVQDIYGVTLAVLELALSDWDIVDFRPLKAGDVFYGYNGLVQDTDVDYPKGGPRLILKKRFALTVPSFTAWYSTVKDIYGGDVELPIEYECVNFRLPVSGETVLAVKSRKPYVATENLTAPRIILRKRTGERAGVA